MAQFIDERQEEDTEEEFTSFEETSEEETSEAVEDTEDTEEEDELPGKYQGKDIKDIIAMHQNAEQLLGKQGQEVGELRRIVDDFIKAQSVTQQQAQPFESDVDDLDFFENPKGSIEKMLANHPSLKQTQQIAAQLKQQETVAKLKSNHPDYLDVVKDPKFGEWVQKSKIRMKLLQEADQGYDFDSADELLTLWKERQGTINTTVNAEKAQRKQQVKTASAGTSKGSAERPSRKIYRRSDIIDLMRKDPERYESLMPEIRAAYAEGRVK